MTRYRLVLAYDGADFHGWQRQSVLRSVQGELERALSVLDRKKVPVQGAGRTDAGVHALAQCASFTLERPRDPYRLLANLRGLLPRDITPLRVHEVDEEFNARFSATGRHYIYRMGRQHCAPLRGLRWELPKSVDLDRMRATLPHLAAAEDFRALTTSQGAAKGTICHLRELELLELEAGELRLRIGADRFLHNMVRIIVGTLVEIGRERWAPEYMAEILASGDRTLGGLTAPPQGLFMSRVTYPERFLEPDERD
jgi:tRNA pseudouridine38-40 synthase